MTALLMKVRDAASALGISPRKAYNLINEGSLPAVNLGQRCTMVPVEAIDAVLALIPEPAHPPTVVTVNDGAFDPRGFFVYRLLDDAGCVLYVGRSKNVLARVGSHLAMATRRHDIAGVAFERCATFAQMCSYESQLIAELRPPWNSVGVDRRQPPVFTRVVPKSAR